jgi:hypothetical protein
MENNRIPPITLVVDEAEYTMEFGIEQVKGLANRSKNLNGRILVSDLIKYALKKNHDFEATDFLAKNIYHALLALDDDPEAERTYMEMLEWIYRLFGQAIDDAARELEPASIEILKDNAILVGYNGEKYKLTFSRSDLEKAYQEGAWEYDLGNPLEVYTAGLDLVKIALKNTGKSYSAKTPEKLFLSMWATTFVEETKEQFIDALHSLLDLRKEIANSGLKNSKAVIKLMPRKDK